MSRTKTYRHALFTMLVTFCFSQFFISSVHAAEHTLEGNLRTDPSAVYQARDYTTYTLAKREPIVYAVNRGDSYFRAGIAGSIFSDSYVEVGIRLFGNGNSKWYVRTLHAIAIDCLIPGSILIVQPNAYRECQGSVTIQPIISIKKWYRLQVVTYNQGFWIARIYDDTGYPRDVARVYEPSNLLRIGGTYQSTRIEAYPGSFAGVSFNHWHPYFMAGGSWVLWPLSNSSLPTFSRNKFWVAGTCSPVATTPSYKGFLQLSGDPRFWFAGYWDSSTTYTPTCNSDPMF